MTVGGIATKPGMVEGRVEPRGFLALTLTFGYDSLDFAQRLRELVEGSEGVE